MLPTFTRYLLLRSAVPFVPETAWSCFFPIPRQRRLGETFHFRVDRRLNQALARITSSTVMESNSFERNFSGPT
jgi:hypothetical protein